MPSDPPSLWVRLLARGAKPGNLYRQEPEVLRLLLEAARPSAEMTAALIGVVNAHCDRSWELGCAGFDEAFALALALPHLTSAQLSRAALVERRLSGQAVATLISHPAADDTSRSALCCRILRSHPDEVPVLGLLEQACDSLAAVAARVVAQRVGGRLTSWTLHASTVAETCATLSGAAAQEPALRDTLRRIGAHWNGSTEDLIDTCRAIISSSDR